MYIVPTHLLGYSYVFPEDLREKKCRIDMLYPVRSR